MPAGFRRHLVGKTLTNVCYSDVSLSSINAYNSTVSIIT